MSKSLFEERRNENCKTKKPDIPRAGRGGKAHGRAAGQVGAGQGRTPTGRFAQETTAAFALKGIRDNCSECVIGSTDNLKRHIRKLYAQVILGGQEIVPWARCSAPPSSFIALPSPTPPGLVPPRPAVSHLAPPRPAPPRPQCFRGLGSTNIISGISMTLRLRPQSSSRTCLA